MNIKYSNDFVNDDVRGGMAWTGAVDRNPYTAIGDNLSEACEMKRGRPKLSEEERERRKKKREMGRTKKYLIGEEPNRRKKDESTVCGE